MLHAQTLYIDAKQNPGTFDNPMYDAVHMAAKLLFPGNKVVTTTDREIIIRARVTVRMYLSWNENKVYIDTFATPEDLDKEELYKIYKHNYTFRLFSLDEVLAYLEMKARENAWIKANEG